MADVLALCYHGVSDTWPASISVTPQRLRRQLQSLLRRGYRGATLRDAVAAPSGGRLLAVTFDDSYRSVLEVAFPILESLGLPGSLYVPTAFAGDQQPMRWSGIDEWLDGPHDSELLPLDWAELQRLAAAGWEIGSHTHTHPRLTDLSDAALREELTTSRRELEQRLGRPCDSIAYPYGDCDRRVVAAAARAGYRVGAAIASTRPQTPLDWPRVGVYHHDAGWRFRLKSAALVRRARTRGASYAPDAEGAMSAEAGA